MQSTFDLNQFDITIVIYYYRVRYTFQKREDYNNEKEVYTININFSINDTNLYRMR